jgi:hypothetical protein
MKQIRLFVFTESPGEIRDMIYSQLLKPEAFIGDGPLPRPTSHLWRNYLGCVSGGRVLLRYDANGSQPSKKFGYGHPNSEIMQLSKGIRGEATDLLYAKHYFQIFLILGEDTVQPKIPSPFEAECVKDMRVLLAIDCYLGVHTSTALDLSAILCSATSSETLHIAIRL